MERGDAISNKSMMLLGMDGTYLLLAGLVLIVLLFQWSRQSQARPTFPVWAPIEIALTGLICSKGGIAWQIYSSIRRYGGSLYGLTGKHQVLVNLAGVDRFMTQPHNTLNALTAQWTLVTRVFGAKGTAQLKAKFEADHAQLFKPVEEMFVNNASATAAIERGGVLNNAAFFVTFLDDPKQMQRWERCAEIRLVANGGETQAVEANLQSLARDFGACIAIPLLYGNDLLDRYPGILSDLWKFDNDAFPLLVIGIPPWAPFKIMREGVAARSRLIEEMTALYKRIDQYQNGQPVDFGADMSDVGKAALGRNSIYNHGGWSFRERGESDLTILWGQNANTQPLFFWVLVFAYSTPGLLDEIRDEIAPYIKLSQDDPLELTSIDFPALFTSCQRLKACVYETYRMANEATSLRYVARPITLTDGEYKHQLKPGTFVSAPHAVSQRDPSLYPNPDHFVPDRFLETDAESGKLTARYGKLRPWGAGAAMCKGRSFAEKEIIALSAAVFSLWDIGPAGGKWEIPTMLPGTGVKKPVKDIRVVITRRKRA